MVAMYLGEVRLHTSAGAVGEVSYNAALPVTRLNSALNRVFRYDIKASSIEVYAALDPLGKPKRGDITVD